jgi:hypothetical protein
MLLYYDFLRDLSGPMPANPCAVARPCTRTRRNRVYYGQDYP